MITDALIRKSTGQYDPETVQRLCLDNMALRRISGLDRCSNLIELSLPWNEVTEISGLAHLTQLQRLDLSNNRIAKIGIVFYFVCYSIFYFFNIAFSLVPISANYFNISLFVLACIYYFITIYLLNTI